MNVKMYNKILKNSKVRKIYNAPSGSDESLTMGACFYLNRDFKSHPLKKIDLGLALVEKKQSLLKLVKKEFKKNYIIYNNTAPKKIAKLLEKNEIIAIISLYIFSLYFFLKSKLFYN